MTRHFNRREVLQAISLGVVAGSEFVGAATKASVAKSAAQCVVLNHRGEPLSAAEFDRFHTCDLLMRPFTIAPNFEAGRAMFDPPERPFRISLPMTVPGFGQVYVYADNRGRGYTPESFDKPLDLNYELAADRLATVQKISESCRQSGITVSDAARQRADKAQALLDRAKDQSKDAAAYAATLFASLCESLWAGDMIVLERAQQMIVRNGARSGFLFGCNAIGYARRGEEYAQHYGKIFNFATLPFYRRGTESTLGTRDYSGAERILERLAGTSILPKGHPLIFLVPNATPAWLRDLSFEETKRHCVEYIRDTILKFRNRIHTWDVVNEAHVQPDNGPEGSMQGFTKEQNVDLTVAALEAAREADPTCFRIVNSTGTWCDYYMGRNPLAWQQSVYDYLQMCQDAGAEYEAVGLQYYHSGRDMLEFERNLETFQGFGKPVHISEIGYASSTENDRDSAWWGGGDGNAKMPWHGDEFSEENQADWVESFYTIAFSKTFVHAIGWWDFCDPAFIPNGGFLRRDLTPKPSFERLRALQEKWRQEGMLADSQS